MQTSTSRPRARSEARGTAVVPLFTAVPGRARLHVRDLRGRPAFARRLEDVLADHPAVRTARTSTASGNVLVLFDARRLTVPDLLAVVNRSRRAALAGPGAAAAGASPPDLPWHTLPAEQVTARLGTAPATGLDGDEAVRRLLRIGPNRMPLPRGKPLGRTILDQLDSLPVYLLAGAAGLSLLSGDVVDALVIAGVVAINTTVGAVMERRSERALAALRTLGAPQAVVRRDGKERVVPASDLVPGDVIVLKAGFPVGADGRLVEASGLRVNESALTGESEPAAKAPRAVFAANEPLADRTNMVYAGTLVEEGRGLAVVTGTAQRTEVGRIRALVADVAIPPTPLERQLDSLGRRLVVLSLGACGVALGLGLLRGVPFVEMLRTSISLAVAAVPEGLPAVATTTLALGMQRMRRRHAVIRQLEVVENLGAVTVVCVDKTGTITENRMTVAEWHVPGRTLAASNGSAPSMEAGTHALYRRALEVAVLCNEAQLPANDGAAGDGSSTELALLRAATAAGIDAEQLRRAHPTILVRPRRDTQYWMATVHAAGPGRRLVMVKGAPESVLRLATRRAEPDGIRPLDEAARGEIRSANAGMAMRAMRVLGLAFKELGEHGPVTFDDLVWVGLVGLADRVRPGVREAIAACHRAGIRTIMMTGDQKLTATAVCRELGLLRDGRAHVLDASALAHLDPRDVARRVRDVDVFARVSPVHKYEIVRALQAAGEVVAMTGDGINDAPALRRADVGIAMGAGGTAVARSLADVVLLDDNFTSILEAVAQGRTIYANTRKSLRFLLSTNGSEILTTVTALALGVARPLSAIQFLWINLLSDVFPALALAVEPAEPGVMSVRPRDPREAVVPRAMLSRIGWEATGLSAAALGAYGLALGRHGVGARSSTVAFSALTSAQLLHALACRSTDGPALGRLGRSPALVAAVAGTLALQVGAVTLPPLRRLLGTTPLGGVEWGVVGAASLLPLLGRELLMSFTPGNGMQPGRTSHGEGTQSQGRTVTRNRAGQRRSARGVEPEGPDAGRRPLRDGDH